VAWVAIDGAASPSAITRVVTGKMNRFNALVMLLVVMIVPPP
jgi:hypothetical protein